MAAADAASGMEKLGSVVNKGANETTPRANAEYGGDGRPLSPNDNQRAANIPNPPPNLKRGPYTPKPSTPGNRPGSFQGPKQESGPRSQLEWVPPKSQGGPPGSEGYWKVQIPGQKGWERFNQSGEPISPEQAHPNPTRPSRSFFFLGPAGAVLCILFCESPAK